MEILNFRLFKSANIIFVVTVLVLLSRGALADAGLVGTWVGEPVLSQLGYIQTTYTFKSDGKFTQKNDFKSFCGMKAVTPDCIYFWNIVDGTYVRSGNSLMLRAEKATSIQLREGESQPITKDMGMNSAQTENLPFLIDPKKAILTITKKGAPQTFKRVTQSSKQ